MAKKKGEKTETKSDFLRRVLARNPNLDYDQVNARWTKAGHPGEISNPLYYLIRRELGIKTEWAWVKVAKLESPRGASSTGAAREVYQFKITLKEATPPIWRRIQVEQCSLNDLHEHIQTAMGWTNSHLHWFKIDGVTYGDPRLLDDGSGEIEFVDSLRTKLSTILPEGTKTARFEYEYDFGDGWMHDVLFEGRQPAHPGRGYPICIDGARACPPEDVGGVGGYAYFLEAIADPEHERHQDLRDWIGRKFNSKTFDSTKATKEMRKGLPAW